MVVLCWARRFHIYFKALAIIILIVHWLVSQTSFILYTCRYNMEYAETHTVTARGSEKFNINYCTYTNEKCLWVFDKSCTYTSALNDCSKTSRVRPIHLFVITYNIGHFQKHVFYEDLPAGKYEIGTIDHNIVNNVLRGFRLLLGTCSL